MLPPLVVEDQPAAADIQVLEDEINRYNVVRTGIQDGTLLALFERNAAGVIEAGLYGWTWGGCCEVRYLWVSEELRGHGHGSRLLAAAEAEARRRGCTQVVLDTHSFQAPLFYQKFGYRVIGIVDDYPLGYGKYYLLKELSV